MSADRLRDERLSRITGVLNAHHAALVDETADLLANEDEWLGPGVWTIESYLQWRTGVSSATARQLSMIARRVDDLPASMAAFRRGELTLDQMAAVARRAPVWIDDEVRELAVTLTVNQLERVLRTYPFPTFDTAGIGVAPPGLTDIEHDDGVERDGDADADPPADGQSTPPRSASRSRRTDPHVA